MDYQKEVEEATKELQTLADEIINEIVDPMAKIPSPEKILGKPYEQWTPQDVQTLQGIYVYDVEPLNKFIGSKEIDELFKSQELTRQLEG